MRNSAVSSSRWALSRWVCASAGTTSLTAVFRRWPMSVATSTSRSVSRVTSLALRWGGGGGAAGAREPHPQLAVLDRGAHRVAVGEHPGQRDLATVVADRD